MSADHEAVYQISHEDSRGMLVWMDITRSEYDAWVIRHGDGSGVRKLSGVPEAAKPLRHDLLPGTFTDAEGLITALRSVFRPEFVQFGERGCGCKYAEYRLQLTDCGGEFEGDAPQLVTAQSPEAASDGAIVSYDDGSKVYLDSFTAGAREWGGWGEVTLLFEDASGAYPHHRQAYRKVKIGPTPERVAEIWTHISGRPMFPGSNADAFAKALLAELGGPQ
jgi:hypothetical protein